MNYSSLRDELRAFYGDGFAEAPRIFAEKCHGILDSLFKDGMSVSEQKMLQYRVISELFEPTVFKNLPFYFETGAINAISDGGGRAKGYGYWLAGGWTYLRNHHLFEDRDPDLYAKRRIQSAEKLYLICGPYNDTLQHFNFNLRPILQGGLKGIYERAQSLMPLAKNRDEAEFLQGVCEGMLGLKKMAEKFAAKAEEMLRAERENEHAANLRAIADTAKRVPWEAPCTFYEALCTLAFLRPAFAALEGVGPNTFGRVDKDLIGFYREDIAEGRLTREGAYDLICRFLLLWDCHYDHDMVMAGYADHELENTYTLGGCDDDGSPLFNELTELFLIANREEKIIFPKIKCRYSSSSPKEYFDLINESVVNGTSTVLFQNDEATVAAIERSGRPISEARDYFVTGCWGTVTNQEKYDHGNYVNLLKPFEFGLHRLTDKIESVGIDFEVWDDSLDFEGLYALVLRNCGRLIDARIGMTRDGGHILADVDRLHIFSSTLENCLEARRDYSLGGAKYRDEYMFMFGLPNIVDSLLAIRELVFEEKRSSLPEFLGAVRADWVGREDMREAAKKCHGWGDGSEASCALAARFHDDLYKICSRKVGGYGGRVHLAYLTYTEIRWWGEVTLATPDGRKNGEYFSQGLTPSRLKRIPCVNDVINSFAAIDGSKIAGNSVVNIILPGKIPLAHCEAFLRATAKTAVQCLQLNCTSKDELLDAQKHPENYPDLIVRVTGFSAKFTSLSPEWQDEVISRNFYE